MEQTRIILNNGCEIPQFGIGVYQVRGNARTKQVCLEALRNGYRHIVFPKSENPAHISSNIEIFDFALNGEEMDEIRALDKNTRFYEPATMPLEKQEEMMCGWKVPD